jgi:hypothetical protein
MDKIINRILNDSGCPELLEILSGLKASDLQSLLLKLYSDKTSKLTPGMVLRQYENNRFVIPVDIDPRQLIKFETLAFSLLPPGFEAILFPPLSPLGSCSVLGNVSQNNIVSTIRNTELCSDSTNVMALESAKRRKKLKNETVKLASFQRLTRAQNFENPAFSSHFSIFSLTTAGSTTANCETLLDSLFEHIEFYLNFLKSGSDLGFAGDDAKIGITAINLNLKQKLQEKIINPLVRKYPDFTFEMDQARKSALNYYKDFALAINIRSPLDGNYYQLVDGGNTDWTQKFLNNRKEFFLSSCIGIDLFLRRFERL